MKRIDIDVFYSYMTAKERTKAWQIDAHFAAVRWDGAWQLGHIATGLITRWKCRLSLAQAVQFGQAASKRFGPKTLTFADADLLRVALLKAGCVKWSKRRMSQIIGKRKKAA